MNAYLPCRFAFVTGGLSLGGANTFLCNIGSELVRRGVPVRVFSFEEANPFAVVFERERIPLTIVSERAGIYEDRIASCLKELRAFSPTLVVSTLSQVSFEILRYLPLGVQRAGMVQSDYPEIYSLPELFGSHMDGVVGVSRTIARRLGEMKAFSGLKVEYIPYGVPMPDKIALAPAVGGPLRILYLGRLDHAQKRVRIFPQIFRQLCESGIPFRWTIAGGGPEREFLEAEMTGGSQDQRVVFTGPLGYEAVPSLLEEQDVILLASHAEGLPLSLLEAMGQGLAPVVTALESGIPEIVNEGNGILVPVDDIPGYARAMIHLHENREELAAKRVSARRSVYPAFTIAAMADRWIDFATTLATTSLAAVPEWPSEFKVKPPLGGESAFRFSPLARFFRRTVAGMSRFSRR